MTSNLLHYLASEPPKFGKIFMHNRSHTQKTSSLNRWVKSQSAVLCVTYRHDKLYIDDRRLTLLQIRNHENVGTLLARCKWYVAPIKQDKTQQASFTISHGQAAVVCVHTRVTSLTIGYDMCFISVPWSDQVQLL